VTPVQKVLEMMTQMKGTSEKMMEGEAATFRKYTEWADDQQTELGFEIKTGKSEIEKLTAFIEGADLDVEKLGKEVQSMDKEIGRMETEMKEATVLRKEENDIYMKTQQDLAESVDAIGKAQDVVEASSQDKEQAAVLLQRMSTKVPKMPLILAAFLEEEELGAPKAAAYGGQSAGILSMLDGLAKKFKKELDECELEESNKANAYELELQHLSDTVAATKVDLSEKRAGKGKTSADSAKAKGELLTTKDELAADEKMLVEVKSTFKTKKSSFDANQKVREDELTAMSKAIEIISSPQVSLLHKSMTTSNQVTSLLQTQSSKARIAVRQRLSTFLERRAALLSSSTLKAFAHEVSSSPFAKVTGLINTLIAKLKEEAAAEGDHKKWCDDQLKANKLTRNKESTQADKLSASVEKLSGEIDTMGKEIATLLSEQAALTKAQSKATDLRAEEKSKNAATVKDSTAGADALKQALLVLKKFYASQAFAQMEQAPSMEDYKGNTGASTGIIGMLEVIESDFLRLKAETAADEGQAQKEYDKFMSDATKNKTEKHAKEVKRKLEKDKAEHQKSLDAKDLTLTKTKLDKATDYYSTLKPTCVEIHVDSAERADRRKQEVEALKEAYGILDTKNSD